MEQSKIIDTLETYHPVSRKYDKGLIRLQRIYNLWSIHAMFITILYGFGMIWLELTRTDAVFRRTTVVLFFVQK